MKCVSPRLEHNTRRASGMHWLGTALIDLYEASEKDTIKTDLLEQVVAIIRRQDRRDERVREIMDLMRDWQQIRG
jgi:hypothetical protein